MIQCPTCGSETFCGSSELYIPETPSFLEPDHLKKLTDQIAAKARRSNSLAEKLEEAAVSARRESDRWQAVLKSYQNHSSPVFRLPTEVLALIFERCLEQDSAGHVFSRRSVPWKLAQTCRRWRSTVLTTPSLWNVVRLDINRAAQRPESVKILQIWLERSQTLPISCLIILGDSSLKEFDLEVIDTLLLHSMRWAHIDLDFRHHGDLYHRLVTSDMNLPLLVSLRMRAKISTQHPDFPNDWCHLPNRWIAPRLTEVSISLLNRQSFMPIFIIPWPQLTELSWTTSPKAFLKIGSTFSHLQYCVIYFDFHHPAAILPIPKCTLPRLRCLHLSGTFSSVFSFINHISVPVLEDLSLDFWEQISPVSRHLLSALSRLRTRSSFELKYLSVPLAIFDCPDAPTLLENFGNIRELGLIMNTEESYDQALPHFLHLRVLRNLEILHLTFRGEPENGRLFTDILDLVETRRRPTAEPSTPCTTLKMLSVKILKYPYFSTHHELVHLEPFRRLLRLQKDGLVLLGHVVEGRWHTSYRDTRWNPGDVTRAERRWHRFGRTDWLFKPEFEDYRCCCHGLTTHFSQFLDDHPLSKKSLNYIQRNPGKYKYSIGKN
ncbi:hypothetical protein E1B28_012135 [Marasmius oreades]|uniref:F-box domain-containing protein n=1 Tax=Marasmius oreades TaxID=181124 RepID=A0A9P7RR19_9AGAR|nr:uncharacterized protein E1B28_012135 [Marasmius oreades]KAG7088110.1 hypothetical protein E1B28_012135 [Marasmius oreades]